MPSILLHLLPATLYTALGVRFWHSRWHAPALSSRPGLRPWERALLLLVGAGIEGSRENLDRARGQAIRDLVTVNGVRVDRIDTTGTATLQLGGRSDDTHTVSADSTFEWSQLTIRNLGMGG